MLSSRFESRHLQRHSTVLPARVPCSQHVAFTSSIVLGPWPRSLGTLKSLQTSLFDVEIDAKIGGGGGRR